MFYIIDYVLGSITATDPDSDPNHVTLTYTLVTNVEDNGLFAIDKTTVCYTEQGYHFSHSLSHFLSIYLYHVLLLIGPPDYTCSIGQGDE